MKIQNKSLSSMELNICMLGWLVLMNVTNLFIHFSRFDSHILLTIWVVTVAELFVTMILVVIAMIQKRF